MLWEHQSHKTDLSYIQKTHLNDTKFTLICLFYCYNFKIINKLRKLHEHTGKPIYNLFSTGTIQTIAIFNTVQVISLLSDSHYTLHRFLDCANRYCLKNYSDTTLKTQSQHKQTWKNTVPLLKL